MTTLLKEKIQIEELRNITPDPDRPRPVFDWIIPGLRAGMVGLLVAPGGTGKSYLAAELAMSVAAGHSIFDKIAIDKSGPVRVIFFEDDEVDVAMRGDSIGREMQLRGVPLPNPAMYFCHSLAGKNLYLINSQGDEIEENIALLEQMCEGMRLVILDPLTHLHQIDENNNLQATKIITTLHAIALRTQCGIIVLHHTGKAATLNGQGHLQEAARGGTGIVNSCRLVMNLSKHPDNKEWLQLTWSKLNSHAPIDPVNLVRGADGVLTTPYAERCGIR